MALRVAEAGRPNQRREVGARGSHRGGRRLVRTHGHHSGRLPHGSTASRSRLRVGLGRSGELGVIGVNSTPKQVTRQTSQRCILPPDGAAVPAGENLPDQLRRYRVRLPVDASTGSWRMISNRSQDASGISCSPQMHRGEGSDGRRHRTPLHFHQCRRRTRPLAQPRGAVIARSAHSRCHARRAHRRRRSPGHTRRRRRAEPLPAARRR